MNELSREKKRLRNHFREIRKKICEARKTEARDLLYDYLEERIAPHRKILSFASFEDEIDLSQFNQIIEKQGKLHLCGVEGDHLVPYKVTNQQMQLKLDRYKFFEPDATLCLRETHFDVILVPGIAFDEKGGRLGFGKGYYDRLLSQLSPCITIGVGYREQLSNVDLPLEQHDIKVRELCLV